MSRPYSLLFLGHQTFQGTLSLDKSIDCWQQVTVVLHTCFKRLEHVHCSFRDNHAAGRSAFYDELPKVDGILFWGVPQIWMSYDHRRLRRMTQCRAIITVCESAIRERADWRFVFAGHEKSTTCVEAPVWKEVYKQVEKTPKSILLDHWDQDTPSDWTIKIEEWMRDLSSDFDITRYVQNHGDRRIGSRQEMPSEIRYLRRAPYSQWLAATDHFETFVMTHRESYGYAALDMFARGIRVVCPKQFVPPHLRARFHVDTFDTNEELVNILRQPPDPRKVAENKDRLSDWPDVVNLIDRRFQSLLSRRYRESLRRFGRVLHTSPPAVRDSDARSRVH